MLSKRVERALNVLEIKFNKGSVAKILRGQVSRLKSFSDLPSATQERAEAVIAAIRKAFEA